jgi:hypothetical protein
LAKSPFLRLGAGGLGVGYPSGQRGQTVNLLAYAFDGSNPSPTTIFFAVKNVRTNFICNCLCRIITFDPLRFYALECFWQLSQNDARKVIKK